MADTILIRTLDLGGDGLRVAVKDSIDIAGLPTTGGSKALADAPPAAEHAAVVTRLLEAGCRIIGKANMHELAYGVTGINHWTGTPVNPLFPDRVPGGSSSGSATAVAAGLCDFAIGTDTGGSIRTPAACCGVFGLKPSFGRVDRRGAHPAISSLDCIGPFARDMQMLERAMEIILPGYRPVDLATPPKLGLIELDAEVSETFNAALAKAALPLSTRALPSFDKAFAANIAIIGAETWAAFGHLTQTELVGDDVQARLLNASKVTPEQLADAEKVRSAFRDEVDAALEGVDALVLPTMPIVPLRLDEAQDAPATLRLTSFVRQFNLSGHPALTVPLRSAGGLPVGLQLIGRIDDDEKLCAVGREIASRVDIARFAPQMESAQ